MKRSFPYGSQACICSMCNNNGNEWNIKSVEKKKLLPTKKTTAKDLNAPQSYMCNVIMVFSNRQWSIDQNIHYSLSSKDYYDKAYADVFFFFFSATQHSIIAVNILIWVYLFVVWAEFQFYIIFSSFLIHVLFCEFFFLVFWRLLSLMNLIYLLHVIFYANQTWKKKC